MGTRTLQTQRLTLRPFTVEDAPAMFQHWACDPQVTRWLRWAPHQQVAETRALLEQWVRDYRDPLFYNWAVTLQDGTLIGAIGVVRDEQGEYWEPGYAFGRNFWGQGYATEALAAVVEELFAAQGAEVLHCCHAVENPASGAVQRHVGFHPTHRGVYHKYDGTAIPCQFYELTKKEFYDRTGNH